MVGDWLLTLVRRVSLHYTTCMRPSSTLSGEVYNSRETNHEWRIGQQMPSKVVRQAVHMECTPSKMLDDYLIILFHPKKTQRNMEIYTLRADTLTIMAPACPSAVTYSTCTL